MENGNKSLKMFSIPIHNLIKTTSYNYNLYLNYLRTLKNHLLLNIRYLLDTCVLLQQEVLLVQACDDKWVTDAVCEAFGGRDTRRTFQWFRHEIKKSNS